MCVAILLECAVWPAFFCVLAKFFIKNGSMSAHLTSFCVNIYDSDCRSPCVGKKIFSEISEISLDISETYGKLYFMVRNMTSATRRGRQRKT